MTSNLLQSIGLGGLDIAYVLIGMLVMIIILLIPVSYTQLAAMQCLPESLKDRRYYIPTDQGKEAETKEKLEHILAWKKEQGI